MRWLITLALFAPAAAAWAAPDVRYPDKTQATLPEVSRRFQKETGQALRDRWVRVAADGYAPLGVPDVGAKASGAAGVPFLARLNMLGNEYQGVGGKFCLLASGGIDDNDMAIVGWVPASYVIVGDECMSDDKSGIRIKAMVINSLRFLKAGGVSDEARVAPPRLLLAPPPLTGKDNGPTRFFDFFFVWADTDPEHDDRGHALIGENYQFNDNAEMTLEQFRRASKILGWVDKSRLCFWRTREALQWDDRNASRTRRGQAFGSPEHAKSDIDPAAFPHPANPDPPVVEVFTDKGPAVWDPRRMRYPILTMKIAESKEKAADPPKMREAQYESFKGNTLRKVGVIGDVYDEKGRPVMSEAVRQDIQLDIIRTREQLRRTEILFVIDRTNSMQDFWKATATSVERLVSQVGRDGRSVAVGFCFYGDAYPGTDKEGKATLKEAVDPKVGAVKPDRLMDARSEAALLKKKLVELADTSQMIVGGERLEMVFAGLEIGIMEAKGWSKHARKLVVLIGDDGNHRLPPTEEQEVLDRIAELCVPVTDGDRNNADYETPKEFYALQVRKVAAQEGDPTLLFKQQVNRLIDRVKVRSKLTRAEYFEAAQEKVFLEKIEARYAELKAHADRQEEEIQKVQSGQIGAVTEIRDQEVVSILRGIAAKRNMKVEDLLLGAQAFDERFVWDIDPKTGVPQVRRMVLVAGGELDKVLSMFEDYFHGPENRPTLEQLARQMVAAQAGDPRLKPQLAGKTDAEQVEVLAVAYGFSFTDELAVFLGWNLKPGEKRPKPDPAAELRFKQKLEKKYRLLEDLKKEVVCEYVPNTERDKVGLKRLGDGKPLGPQERRGFKRGDGSATFYWVDFDREWP